MFTVDQLVVCVLKGVAYRELRSDSAEQSKTLSSYIVTYVFQELVETKNRAKRRINVGLKLIE